MGRADSTQDAQKNDFLTRQTPADTSPARPEAAKTASSLAAALLDGLFEHPA